MGITSSMFCTVDRAYPIHGSMGLVYLPKWMDDFYGKCSYIYISIYHTFILWVLYCSRFPFILDLFNLIFEKVSLPHSPSKKSHMLFFHAILCGSTLITYKTSATKSQSPNLYSQVSKPTHFPGINRHIVKNYVRGGGGSNHPIVFRFHMGVSKNSGTPKWMVHNL